MNKLSCSSNYSTKSNLTDLVLISYPSDNQIKSGTITVYLTLNMKKGVLTYRGIDYSDPNLKSYVENNPSILSKIDSLRDAFGMS